MILHVLRALFILLMAAVGFHFIRQDPRGLGEMEIYLWLTPAVAITVSVLLVCIDILSPRKKLVIFSGTLFGMVIGLLLAYVLSFVVTLIFDQQFVVRSVPDVDQRQAFLQFVNLLQAITCCYFSISFVLQTKDDFRFIVPYVEFAKETKGARPALLDTSVLIDGRIADVVDTGLIESQLIVPRFVLLELQAVADSGDKLKRNRGKRGLDVLARLRASERTETILYESARGGAPGDPGVDEQLMLLAKELNARVFTNDFNLNKVAQLRGVDVLNINDLTTALRPVVLPGERMSVRIVKPGDQVGQGVGYLDDGTMVVVEQGRDRVGDEVEVTVTSALQTSAGRMIFGRLGADPSHAAPKSPAPASSTPNSSSPAAPVSASAGSAPIDSGRAPRRVPRAS